jgi:hypothetical protein
MKVRELERLLGEHGFGAAKMDAVTRRLRDAARLPVGGRGPNAPHISALEATIILLASAGSSKGAEADMRLKKLEPLPCTSTGRLGNTLAEALTALLHEPAKLSELRELRVARTRASATFLFADGTVEEYGATGRRGERHRFHVEGILPNGLLMKVAATLALPQLHEAKREG